MTKNPSSLSRSIGAFVIAVGLAVSYAACGGGGGNPGGPSPTTVIVRSTGSAGQSGATVNMTSAGVNPGAVTVAVGQSVTFTNSDSKVHEIASDPHPVHGSCPSIEAGLGTIQPGQSKLTQGFANAGTCTYHDHLDNGNASFQGRITVQ